MIGSVQMQQCVETCSSRGIARVTNELRLKRKTKNVENCCRYGFDAKRWAINAVNGSLPKLRAKYAVTGFDSKSWAKYVIIGSMKSIAS